MRQTISIVGAGRVGRSLGRRLRERGWRIGAVVTRSGKTARAAVRAIGAGSPFTRLTRRPLAADVILICTADDHLPAVARTLAQVGKADCKGKTVLHTSATLDRSVLDPFARLGAATGSLHPMQAFGGNIVPSLRGVIFAIEGDPKARRVARELAKSLGGVPVDIATRDKPVYHAAAVLAAGSAYPTIEAGVQLLLRIGFTRARAMQTLLPLVGQILDNIGRIGPRAAWTGPLSRGDYAIVAKHARALRGYPREIRQAYASLSLLAGRVLSKSPEAAMVQVRRALKNARGGPS
jgi:predicted short-subunit dehydrogenase-like oxidoreductase (DUF2520 family)